MSQIVNISSLPNFYAMEGANAKAADSGRVDMRMVFGYGVSLAVAECQPGYHPAPQIHACEQIVCVRADEVFNLALKETRLKHRVKDSLL